MSGWYRDDESDDERHLYREAPDSAHHVIIYATRDEAERMVATRDEAERMVAALAASAPDERTVGRPGEYVGWAGPDRTANDAASATDEGPREPITLSIAESRNLPRDHVGVWFCVCGAGWMGTANMYPDDLRSHAEFRVSGGEPGSAHDPDLARFRPDTARPAVPALDVLTAAISQEVHVDETHGFPRGFTARDLAANIIARLLRGADR